MAKPTSSGQYLNYHIYNPQQGWQCPVCGKILAPWLSECPCQGLGSQTVTATTINYDQIEKIMFRRIDNGV